MSKKLFIAIAAVLMAFAGTTAVFAATTDAVTVYLEPSSATATLFGDAVNARAVFLDATGNLATTFAGGPIGDAVLELKSTNFPTQIYFDDVVAGATPSWPTGGTSGGKFEINIDNSGYQEFTYRYDNGSATAPVTLMTEVGDDIIVATLKKGTTSILSQVPVTVKAPTANCYYVRTGLASSLAPDVLEALPAQQNDASAVKTAGSSVNVTVLAAFGIDTTAIKNGTYDTFIFTDQVPAGGESVAITGTSDSVTIAQTNATLTNGIGSVDVTVQDLKIPDIIERTTSSPVAQVHKMNYILGTCITVTWSAQGYITREIGAGMGTAFTGTKDVNSSGQVVIDPMYATIGVAGMSASSEYDYSKHKPAPVDFVTLIGLPVNAITGTVQGWFPGQGAITNYTAAQIGAPDAYNLLADPKAKPSTFNVAARAGVSSLGIPGTPIYGAIVGYDQYSNPAPITTDGTKATFILKSGSGLLNAAMTNTYAVADWSTFNTTYSKISATANYQAFIPFVLTATASTSSVADVFLARPANLTDTQYKTTIFENVDTSAEGVKYMAQANTSAMSLSGSISGFRAGDDDVSVSVTGTAAGSTSGDEAFTMRGKTFRGRTIKMNKKGSTTPQETVTIPNDSTTTHIAKEDVVFFTKVAASSEGSNSIFLLLQGKSNGTLATFRQNIGPSGILVANGKDFPPKGIATLINTVQAILDTDYAELILDNSRATTPPIPTFLITDAFDNTYTGTTAPIPAGAPGTAMTGSEVNVLEDANATLEVQKADGTAYPGADAEFDGDNLIVSFGLDTITAANGYPVVKITAGAGSALVNYNVRVLKQTVLDNLFVPIPGVDDTPVALYFADQSGTLIKPVTTTTAAGFYDVDIEATGGTTSHGDDATVRLSTTNYRDIFTAELDVADADKIMTITADGGDADAGDTTLTLDFNPDFTAPEVGAVTVGSCSISIALTDNKALDVAGSTAVIKKGDTGEDITATLTRTNTGDGAATGSIDFTNVPIGSYTLTIVAKDKANNVSASTARTAEVTECTVIPAACKTVDPTYGIIGETAIVTITGENTNFGATSTVTFSCTGVTVNSVTANSTTEIIAHITIDATAAVGKCDVKVITGAEAVSCDEGFELLTTPPLVASCKSVSPAQGDAGDAVKVTITGENTTFDATSTVTFSCAGITVASVTANSATQITANITIAATASTCTGNVTVKTGTETITCTNAFTVNTAAEECTLTVSPESIRSGFIFPRIKIITITGTNANFSESSSVEIDGVRRVFILSASKTQIKALIIVPARLKGEKAVTVDTNCTGTVTFN